MTLPIDGAEAELQWGGDNTGGRGEDGPASRGA